jgi:catechol 2,3-dioxygenase-like lactoylglutathione lyase family enzyme
MARLVGMALHGLGSMTLGVPNVDATREFYREFGLAETATGTFASSDGGEQLHVVSHPYRRLVSVSLAADDLDDVARIEAAARGKGCAVTRHANGSISVTEPITGLGVAVAVRARVSSEAPTIPPLNAPGNMARNGERAPALFNEGPARPRRLGHVLYTTTDFEGSMRFLIDVLGFKLSDSTPGVIAFLRCSTDHHNIGLINAPVPFFHHSSWQVNGVDEIGQGAQHLLEGDADRSVWGLGRHFLGSNYFWYFRDPAGNYAEYFADLDQIGEDVAWVPGEWEGPKSLYAWGPPVPPDFVHPRDVNEIVDAMKAAG